MIGIEVHYHNPKIANPIHPKHQSRSLCLQRSSHTWQKQREQKDLCTQKKGALKFDKILT